MSLFALLKGIHMASAFLSVGGFMLRGFWMLQDSPLLRHRVVKTLPHAIDTMLLGSAVGMLIVLQVSPFATPWLLAKILALLLYIVLGMIALRFGRTRGERVAACLAALLVALYIVSVAATKSTAGLFSYI